MNANQVRTVGRDVGLLLIRVVLAVVFIYHGGQKLFGLFGGHGLTATAAWMESVGIPLPLVSATLAGSAEFFGGLLLLTGIAVRLTVIPMAFTMLVAMFSAHQGFDARSGGVEYPLTLCVVLVALGLLGPGRFAIGALFTRRAAQSLPHSAAVQPA